MQMIITDNPLSSKPLHLSRQLKPMLHLALSLTPLKTRFPSMAPYPEAYAARKEMNLFR
jgi:hypothetical protein